MHVKTLHASIIIIDPLTSTLTNLSASCYFCVSGVFPCFFLVSPFAFLSFFHWKDLVRLSDFCGRDRWSLKDRSIKVDFIDVGAGINERTKEGKAVASSLPLSLLSSRQENGDSID